MSKLNVLYEDNHVIVVEKPINVLSQGDATGDKDLLTMVKEYVKVKYNKPWELASVVNQAFEPHDNGEKSVN